MYLFITQIVGYFDHGTGHLNHLNNETLKVHYSDPHCKSDPPLYISTSPFDHAVEVAVEVAVVVSK